ncbi:MAG: S8 family serine peptidase [Gammaproteobacteria bacterium]|nr:S8 family serine peptidase [Gammaproteobacteria bacterium]
MPTMLHAPLLLSALLLFLTAAVVEAGDIAPQLQEVLDTAAPQEEVAVIIQLKEQLDRKQFKKLKKKLRRHRLLKELKKKAATNQASLRAYLNNQGGKKLRSLWIINGVAVKAKPSVIRKLAKRPEVLEVRLDKPVPLVNDAVTASAAAQWNLAMLGTDALWAQGYHGQGVVIASMDSGVDYNHAELSGNWRGGTNSWFDPHGEHALPYDADGHGTQAMGIMVGQNLGATAIGMAPLAQWIAVKIFDDNGEAFASDIHAGYQWLLDPDDNPASDDTPDIVNNSWGFPETENTCDTEFLTDIQILRDLEISVVFSAGNQGAGPTSISPANNPGVFAVGAVDENSLITSFSSQGPSACGQGDIYPAAVAPGFLIPTADLTFGGIFPTATTLATGTSFAAPHVTGAMALLLSVNPELTPDDLEAVVTQASFDLGDAGADNVYGNGLVNVADALALLSQPGQCSDGDSDGYFAQTTCGTASDCNDTNPAIYPGAEEIADDGIDQDCDGFDLSFCSDLDGDGYFAQASCGTAVDCDDTNPDIYPGAPEGGNDGIDQDCNGYDLTIQISKALYRTSKNKLIIHARSNLGSEAGLVAEIPGIGSKALTWKASKQRWQKTINKASTKGLQPDSATIITVTGPEGTMHTNLTIQ